jgi:hypothetical protein
MALPVQAVPIIGQPITTEDNKVLNCLTELQLILTKNVDASNIVNAAITAAKFASSSWLTVTLSTFTPATLYYYRSATGTVYIRHDIYTCPGGGNFTLAASTLLATLPIGYRPSIETYGSFIPYSTTAAVGACSPISISTTGEIRNTVAAVNTTTPLCFFDLQFRVEN